MIRPSALRHGLATWLIHRATLVVPLGSAHAQAPTVPETTPGQFFTITEPITNETIQHIRAATRQLVDQERRRGQGKESDPGVRVPARRISAGNQQDSAPRSIWPT